MTERGMIARLRARLHGDERGFTMIEVAVAMILFGVLHRRDRDHESSTMNMIRSEPSPERGREPGLRGDGHRAGRPRSRSSRPVGPTPPGPSAASSTHHARLGVGRRGRELERVQRARRTPSPSTSASTSTSPGPSCPASSPWTRTRSSPRRWAPTTRTPGTSASAWSTGTAPAASDVLVTISPSPPSPTPASQVTTADGCAFFAYLPAGVVHGDGERLGVRELSGGDVALPGGLRRCGRDDLARVRLRPGLHARRHDCRQGRGECVPRHRTARHRKHAPAAERVAGGGRERADPADHRALPVRRRVQRSGGQVRGRELE